MSIQPMSDQLCQNNYLMAKKRRNILIYATRNNFILGISNFFKRKGVQKTQIQSRDFYLLILHVRIPISTHSNVVPQRSFQGTVL
jgi:hypothetical protein